MATIDLKYKNKEGITLKKVLDTISKEDKLSKKDISTNVKATKSIDTLINKLIDAELIQKITEGRAVFFCIKEQEVKTKKKVSKAKPKKVSKKKTDEINKATAVISKNHEITSLVEMEEKKSEKKPSEEVDQSDLDFLKEELESRTGKEVTAILHPRNEAKPKKKVEEASEIYDKIKDKEDVINQDNPYRFVLNFFVTTLNGELATNYFRRRDNYVVKSIYNKLKTMCEMVEEYDTEQQHLPFYRAITINKDDMTVKMYHIDMNRMVRGSYTIFKIDPLDIPLIFGFKGQKNEY